LSSPASLRRMSARSASPAKRGARACRRARKSVTVRRSGHMSAFADLALYLQPVYHRLARQQAALLRSLTSRRRPPRYDHYLSHLNRSTVCRWTRGFQSTEVPNASAVPPWRRLPGASSALRWTDTVCRLRALITASAPAGH
jgi:hypothetical protein